MVLELSFGFEICGSRTLVLFFLKKCCYVPSKGDQPGVPSRTGVYHFRKSKEKNTVFIHLANGETETY